MSFNNAIIFIGMLTIIFFSLIVVALYKFNQNEKTEFEKDNEKKENNNNFDNYINLTNEIETKESSKAPYFFWFAFYFVTFWLITRLITHENMISFIIIFSVYTVLILFSLCNPAEKLWRLVNGVRPLRIRYEKLRLLPLFKEVYLEAYQANNYLSKEIKLFIQENMDINAFAFGRETLVLTRGSIELLNDDCLKGLIAHELGHFSHGDTIMALIMSVGNLFVSLFMTLLTNIKTSIDSNQGGIIMGLIKFVFDVIFYIFKSIEFIANLTIMYANRQHEYQADLFALKCGFGLEMASVLIEIYKTLFEKPQSIKEMINSAHPHITKRIERLEKFLY